MAHPKAIAGGGATQDPRGATEKGQRGASAHHRFERAHHAPAGFGHGIEKNKKLLREVALQTNRKRSRPAMDRRGFCVSPYVEEENRVTMLQGVESGFPNKSPTANRSKPPNEIATAVSDFQLFKAGAGEAADLQVRVR